MKTSTNTKDQILNASLKLFAENSYHGASIRDIAKEIQKRESSIYNHFSSKDDILDNLITKLSDRNFGQIILTDKLINIISKPEKFFLILSENIIKFWSTEEERMFIKLLLGLNNVVDNSRYSLDNYLKDFRSLCEFIFKEMIGHKFIKKFDVQTLSQQFISPLFLLEIEILTSGKSEKDQKIYLKKHTEFLWSAIKS